MFICEICGYSTKIKCNFDRHQNRKTKCGDKTGISVHSDSLPVHVPVHSDSLPVHSNNTPVHSGTKDIVEYVDDTNIKCLKCNGTYHPSYMARHLQMCQNIPLTTCEFCLSNFSSKQSKCNHRKNCKQKQRLVMSLEQGYGNVINNTTNNNNNTTNNNNNTTNNITNNITNTTTNNNHFNVFGKEELGYILENMETDPRIRECLKSLVDTIELVHFNRDHPENHTVRKLNKKSELVEFRVMDNTNPNNERWVQESCVTCIPKMKRNLEISLNTRFCDVPSPTIFKELMYHKSKQSTFASTECLLLEHGNEPHDSKVQEMNKRLYYIREDYLKNTSPILFGNYSGLLELKHKWNDVLIEYGEEPIGIKTVANIVLEG